MANKKQYTAKEAIKTILEEYTKQQEGIDLSGEIVKRVKADEVDLFRSYLPSISYVSEIMANQFINLSNFQSVKFGLLNLESNTKLLILLLNPQESGSDIEGVDTFIKEYVEETKSMENYKTVETKITNNQGSIEMILNSIVRQLNQIIKYTSFIKAYSKTFEAQIELLDKLEQNWQQEYLYFYKDKEYFKKLKGSKSYMNFRSDLLGEYELPTVNEVKQIAKMYEEEYYSKMQTNYISFPALDRNLNLPEPIQFIKEYTPYTIDFLLERAWIHDEEKK